MMSASTYARFACLETGSEKPFEIVFALFDSTWSCCGQTRASKNKHPLYFWISTKMVFIIVVSCTCSVVTRDGVTGSARQLDSQLVQRSSHTWHVAYMSWQLCFFCFACKFFFCMCFVVDPTFVAGDLGHEISQSDWGFPCRVSPACICRACVMAIDSPVTITVITGWVLSWYSQCPHIIFLKNEKTGVVEVGCRAIVQIYAMAVNWFFIMT